MAERYQFLETGLTSWFYLLTWNSRNKYLKLKIRKNVLLFKIDYDDLCSYLMREYEFEFFQGSFGEKELGFNGVFILTKETKLYWEYEIEIPSQVDLGKIFAISATFHVLFDKFFYLMLSSDNEVLNKNKDCQILTFNTLIENGLKGFGVSGFCFSPFVQFLHFLNEDNKDKSLSRKKSEIRQKTIKSMMYVQSCVFGRKFPFDIRVNLDRRFSIYSQSGCSVGVAPSFLDSDIQDPTRNFWEFNSDNVDSPSQQLMLLVGLATLCTEIQKWLKKNKKT